MNITKSKCSRCGNIDYVIPSNNPLVVGICNTCLNNTLDASRLEHFAFFCRTYNFPLSPNIYMNLYKTFKATIYIKYVETLVDNGKLEYRDQTSDVWAEVEKEWSKVKTYSDIMLKIPTVREAFEQRARVKWGEDYSFAELIQLENLLINTIKVYNITDPMRLDSIKKAAKLSVKIDALIESGDAKAIKDYTSSYQSFIKSAQIDELGQIANEGTIKTVSDLYKYLEKNGFQFNFYDKEERDIVDKTINDFKAIIRSEVSNATGLDIKLEDMKKTYLEHQESDVTSAAIEETPLKDILADDFYEEQEMEADSRYETEELDIEYDEDE